MCCYNIRIRIICWMLYRCKFVYFSSFRNNYNSTWVLSGCPFYSCTTLWNPCNFCISYWYISFFIIFFYIAKCCFISNCTNCSSFKCCSFSKYYFCISISGSLSPLNPKNVSKGISIPSFTSLVPHFGQSLSGRSNPFS